MRFLLALLLLVGTLCANPYANLKYYTLENGLEVYLYPDKKAKNVQIEVTVKVGMKAETRETAGLSHLVEHMIFRDSRIKYRDYLDLIKEKGATYVNGYTSYYKTQYVTTINPENAYWITQTFSQMIFDKNVTEEDLRVEKGALQIEIGEPDWTDSFAKLKIGKFFERVEKLFPPDFDLYEGDFGIDTKAGAAEYFDASDYKNNNKKFSLDDVMAHYHAYYFPANMTLKIVGKFDLAKMKETIKMSFAQLKNSTGKSVKMPLFKDAKLSGKPYVTYENAGLVNVNYISLGTKMLADDPKKVAVVKSYMENLADRLNREFRNKKGESYSIYGEVHSYHNATLAAIHFQTPHAVFDTNLAIAQEWLERETSGDINGSVIQSAIKQKLKHHDSIEHDTDSLLSVVNHYESYLRLFGNEIKKMPYDYIKEIAPDEYRAILKEAFASKNAYRVIQRDYVWFPYEGAVLMLLFGILFFYLFLRFFKRKIPKRDIKLYRKVSNIWTIVSVASLAMFVATLLYAWISYAVSKVLGVQSLYGDFDIPLAYLIMIGDFLASVLVLYWVVKKLFSWFYHGLVVTDTSLLLIGPKTREVALEEIVSCEVVPWSPSLWKQMYGMSIFFWKPMLKVCTTKGENFYIRSFHSKHLKEDLALFAKC